MAERSGNYEFGPFRLDVPQRRLLRGSEEIALRMKVFDTLRVLVLKGDPPALPGRQQEFDSSRSMFLYSSATARSIAAWSL